MSQYQTRGNAAFVQSPGCRGKKAWRSKKQARGIKRAMVNQGHGGPTLGVYKCHCCHGWHLGNSPKNIGQQ